MIVGVGAGCGCRAQIGRVLGYSCRGRLMPYWDLGFVKDGCWGSSLFLAGGSIAFLELMELLIFSSDRN